MTNDQHPPKWADRFLTWFCSEEVVETLQGDLYELYAKRLTQRGKFIANLGFVRDVISSCRPFAIKRLSFLHIPSSMHKHNILLVLRNFKRYKSTFIINLVGLSSGLACALFIYLWVADEWSVNKYNANDSRLYQVFQNGEDEVNGIRTGEGTVGILAETLEKELPEVEHAASIVPASWFSEKGILTVGENKIKTSSKYASKDFYRVFTTDFILGNAATSLSDKYGMAISEEMAVKLFRTPENSLGKSVEFTDGVTPHSYHITGVYRNPAHSTLSSELLLNYEIFLDAHPWLRDWRSSDPNTFIVLREGTNVDELNKKIERFIQTKDKESKNTLVIQRYSDHYLNGRFENGVPVGGRIEYVRLFSVVAVFILVIACINFMNLSTAKASRRIKEVGVKKAIGASRQALFVQHLEESMIMAVLSLVAATSIVLLLLPQFNLFTGKNIALSLDWPMILSFVGITVFTGIVAGSYPAIYVSGFRPAEVLKGKLRTSWGELWVRKGLVVFQFSISVLLIVCVVVVYKQIDYVQSKNLGYNRENIVHFDAGIKMENDEKFFAEGGKHEKQIETFVQQIRSIPGVVNAANYEHNLTGIHGGMQGISWKEGTDDDNTHFNGFEVGFDFVETLGIQMAEGRSFSRERANERSKVIFNEEAIQAMGITDPVGKVIKVWGEDKEIIGVAKNFHMESLFEQIRPCILRLEPRSFKVMAKIEPGREAEVIGAMEKLYHDRNPGLAFDYGFVDDDYQQMYVAEQRVSALSKIFAGLTIVISSLGLFGLAAFTFEKRTKEIGIRKILGSSDTGIVYLLSGDFIKMVLMAVVIALPMGYFVSKSWLSGFAYRIELQWWFFLAAAVIAVLVPLVAVGLQTIRAAQGNPVDSLKEE